MASRSLSEIPAALSEEDWAEINAIAEQIKGQVREQLLVMHQLIESRGIHSGLRVTFCQSEDGITAPPHQEGITFFVYGSQYIEITLTDEVECGKAVMRWRY